MHPLVRAKLSSALLPWAAALWLAGSILPAHGEESPATTRRRAAERLDGLGIPRTAAALARAIAAGDRPLVDLFFTAGVEVNESGEPGRTPLLAAVHTGDLESAKRLLSAGADVQQPDATGLTPLMAAAAGGCLTLAEDLLARGADPAAADRCGHTALHHAILAVQPKMVRRLLELNPPLASECCESKDVLGHALESGNVQIINDVLERTPPVARWSAAACDALNAALSANDREFARRLIGKHSSPPTPAEDAQPYVAYAVARSDLTLLETLFDCGASPNVTLDAPGDPGLRDLTKDNFVRHYLEKEPGVTPLMLAAGLGRPELVKTLLEHGANRLQYTRSRSQLLALYFAAWADCTEAVQLLVGEDPPSRDALRVEVDLRRQRATLLKDGSPIFSTEISSGVSGKPTPVGEFVITDKHLEHHSTIYHSASMPFFMRLSCRDFGMHEGYVTGRPASHGCIRLPGSAARKFFRELPIGTWVTVFR